MVVSFSSPSFAGDCLVNRDSLVKFYLITFLTHYHVQCHWFLHHFHGLSFKFWGSIICIMELITIDITKYICTTNISESGSQWDVNFSTRKCIKRHHISFQIMSCFLTPQKNTHTSINRMMLYIKVQVPFWIINGLNEFQLK